LGIVLLWITVLSAVTAALPMYFGLRNLRDMEF
jgi:hypothetical protein